MSAPRPTAVRLLLRQARAEAGTLVALALTTFLVAGVLAAWPRAVERMVADDLAQQVAAQPVVGRDLALPARDAVGGGPVPTPAEAAALVAAHRDQVEARVADAGPALAAVLRGAEQVIERETVDLSKGDAAPDVTEMFLTLLLDPGVADQVEMVEGRLPGPYDAGAVAGEAPGDVTVPGRLPPVEVVVSAATAEDLRWRVGEDRRSLDAGYPVTVRLVGTFAAVDPGAGYWSHLPSTLAASVVDDPNNGVLVTGTAFVAPTALAALAVPTPASARSWYPLDAAAVGDQDREALLADLLQVRAAQGLRSETADVLVAGRAREATVSTVLDVLAAGTAGTALGVLWLAAVLAVERRRAAFVLLRARGASGAAVRGLAAVQGLLVTVPAGAVGALVGWAAVPGPTRAADLVLPALAVLAPALLLALAAGRTAAGRRDLGGPVGRWRWVVEVLVVLAAGIAVAVARDRGLAGATGGGDPVVTALPVVLGLAAAVVVLRVYPWPVRALLAVVRRRPGAGAFLGAAQAARRPAAGIVPVVALVLGVATVALSAVTLSSVTAGTERGAVRGAGADVRVDLTVSVPSGGGLTADQVAAAGAVDGVEAVAAVGDAGRRTLQVGRTTDTVPVRVVDAAALAAVQADLPGVDPLPDALAAPGGALAAVVASGADRDTGADVALVVGMTRVEVPLHVVGAVAEVPGVAAGKTWVLVDRAAWTAATGEEPTVDRLLVRTAPGADPDVVAGAVAEAVDDTVAVRTVASERAEVERSVLVRGTRTALLVVTGLSALLCGGVLALLLLTGAPARGRTTALLRVLGAPAAVRRTLVAAEVAGPLVVSLVGGLLVGAVLPALVLGVADLRLFTGSTERVDPVLDAGTAAALGGVGLLVCAVALVVAVVAARRVAAAQVLREGA